MQLFVYFRFMHDMDKPLGVEQDQLDNIVNTKSIASTCPECEQNMNSTRKMIHCVFIYPFLIQPI